MSQWDALVKDAYVNSKLNSAVVMFAFLEHSILIEVLLTVPLLKSEEQKEGVYVMQQGKRNMWKTASSRGHGICYMLQSDPSSHLLASPSTRHK